MPFPRRLNVASDRPNDRARMRGLGRSLRMASCRERSSTGGLRRLGAWAAVGLGTLKELAPYAAMELLLPGDVDGAPAVVLSPAQLGSGSDTTGQILGRWFWVQVPVDQLPKVRAELLLGVHEIDDVRGSEDPVASVDEYDHGVS
jgi:hypothetical protein